MSAIPHIGKTVRQRLVVRKLQQVNVPNEHRRDDLSPAKVAIGYIVLALIGAIGLLWDTPAIHHVVTFLRMQP